MNSVFLKKFTKDLRTEDSFWRERIVLCLAVLASYASIWPNTFVYDDRLLILLNEFLKHWSNLPKLLTNLTLQGSGIAGGFYRPVQMGLYFLVYQVFGLSAIAFHMLNVSLQALNACLLYQFGIRAGFKKNTAFSAALLWAVHPLHTSLVDFISSTAELLWGSFCLLGLLALLPDFTPRKIWKAMVFFILALGSKESAVIFPALAAITFFLVSEDRGRFSAYLKMWPLWLLSAGYFIVWMSFIHKMNYTLNGTGDPLFSQYYASHFTNRVLTSLATLPVYAGLVVWPAGLYIERVFSIFSALMWQPAAGALMVGLGLLQILSGKGRRGLALSFGLLWCAAALAPYTGIAFPIDALISEGWMYIPSMGLFLGIAQTASGFFETRQNAARYLVLVLAFSLGMRTFFQNEVWRNPETLYQNILEHGGRVSRVRALLGQFYMQRQEFDKAAEEYQYKIDHLDNSSTPFGAAEAHINLAMALLHVHAKEDSDVVTYSVTIDDINRALPASPHITEAVKELNLALQIDPGFDWARTVLTAINHYQDDMKSHAGK